MKDQIDQITNDRTKEKITNEWQNKIKQITDDRTIKQYTYLKTEQADDGTRRQIKQTGKNQRKQAHRKNI